MYSLCDSHSFSFVQIQKHLLLQMMQDTLNVESISDCLGGYLEAAAQAKNKELFNTLVQFEYDIEEEVYFKPGLLGNLFYFII